MTRLCAISAMWVVLGGAIAASAQDRQDAAAAPLRGTVVKVDDAKLVLKAGGGRMPVREVVVATDERTSVRIDGKDGKLADLKAGQVVTVTPAQGIAVRIEAGAAGRVPGRPAAAPAGLQGVVVQVDGNRLTVKAGRREIEVSTDEKTAVKIDGKDAKLSDLKAGQVVSVSPAQGTAARIESPPAGGRPRPNAVRPPAPPQANRRPVEPKDAAAAVAAKVAPSDAPPPAVVRTFNGRPPAVVAAAIDREIDRVLEAERITPAGASDDAEFLRRVYIDITGRIPPADKAAAFLDSADPSKRAALIDALTASPEYGLNFADVWCERIASRDPPVDKDAFVAWLADGFNRGRGWDEIVRDLMTAEGAFNMTGRGRRMASQDPRAFFVLVNTEGSNAMPARVRPEWLAAESAKLFLGVQLQCAECHNHPFTDWKQRDFWGLAAFFGGLRIDRGPPVRWVESAPTADRPVEIVIPSSALKSAGKSIPARFLGGVDDHRPAGAGTLRQTLAAWTTAPDNPYFARAAVNRTWAHFFGRGLVNPVDDLRADNPAGLPAILDLLADEFRKSGCDLRHLIRCICRTAAYQRTGAAASDRSDADKYARMTARVMRPGVLYDSLKSALGAAELKLGLPERRTKAGVITAFSPRETFVDFFRGSQGEEPDPQEYVHGIPQALKLMNAAQLNRVAPSAERAAQDNRTPAQAVEQLYLTALSRRPTAQEAALVSEFLAQRPGGDARAGYSAVLWVLINTSEFVLNR